MRSISLALPGARCSIQEGKERELKKSQNKCLQQYLQYPTFISRLHLHHGYADDKEPGKEFSSKEYLESIYRSCHEAQMEAKTEEREKHSGVKGS